MGFFSKTRRGFLKGAGLSLASLAIAGCNRSFVIAKKRKPNLLFIWTDEQRADTMAIYGNKKIHSPNLNKLASESVVFKKAYVSQPVCTPNRSTVMTGLWPHTSGLVANNIPLGKQTKCLPELLADTDYRTAYMGKWHLGDEIFVQHGFDEWVSIEDAYIKHYSKGRDGNARSNYHHFLIEKGYEPDHSGAQRFSRGFAAKLPIEHCKPKFLELNSCDFLKRNRNNPFILHVNFLEPHMPFYGPLDNEHAPEFVDLPDNFDDPLEENEPLRYRLLREYCIKKYGGSEKEIRELIAKYWGLVTQVDRSVGAILKTLDELELADNTIVVYTSDHGDMMGAHRLVAKCVMYEEAVRIPWLMRIPEMQNKHKVIETPVSQIDMVPTLLDLMDSKAEHNLPGQSLVPLIQGRNVAEDHVFIEWNPGSGAVRGKKSTLASKEQINHISRESTRTVISPDGWKLSLSDIDKSQLFNLNSDPGETTNLFYTGRHKDVINRLTKKIHEWQKKTGDKVKV